MAGPPQGVPTVSSDALAQPAPKEHLKPKGSERAIQRRRLLDAQKFAQDITLRAPKVQERYKKGMEDGTLHPTIERSLLELAWVRPGQIDKRLLDALSDGAGLLPIMLRKPLTEDPLAEPKPVDGKVIEHAPRRPELPAPAGAASIIPPSRPRKPKGSGPPL